MARIVIADDSPTLRRIVTSVLTKEGHEVVAAEDGIGAVQAVLREQPDAVVLDVPMPRVPGFIAARLNKDDWTTQDIPVVRRTPPNPPSHRCRAGAAGTRHRRQDLPDLTKSPGGGRGLGAWPAYRVSNGQMWGMQLRLNDCYRQQRFPYPGFGSDSTIALGVYLGVNGKGGTTTTPAINR